MKKHSPLDYIFALGRIRALEKFLIKGEVFAQAIESSLAEALRLFTETAYSDELLHAKDSSQLETILNKEIADLKQLISELILDKELLCLLQMDNLKDACSTCQIYGSAFLNDYLKHVIDMHNIKSFLRLYVLKKPLEELDALLVCEGFLKKKDLIELYTQDLAAFLNRLEYVHMRERTIDYAYHLKEAIRKTAADKSFLHLEKAINDFLITGLRATKYLVFGPEAIIAYYFAKANEINLMRMIILAKFNRVSDQLVRERLNLVYA